MIAEVEKRTSTPNRRRYFRNLGRMVRLFANSVVTITFCIFYELSQVVASLDGETSRPNGMEVTKGLTRPNINRVFNYLETDKEIGVRSDGL